MPVTTANATYAFTDGGAEIQISHFENGYVYGDYCSLLDDDDVVMRALDSVEVLHARVEVEICDFDVYYCRLPIDRVARFADAGDDHDARFFAAIQSEREFHIRWRRGEFD
jgi:hypothetical protein